ncbi:MAG: ester cyclase [bacterium]|nr:ester cyclase [bacterium]
MNIELNQKNKRVVWDFWQALENGNANRVEEAARLYMAKNIAWNGPDPINQLRGVEAFVSNFCLPLRQSFPDLKRQSHLFFGGESNGQIDGLFDGQMWVCGTGYFEGTFEQDWLMIPATGGEVKIRWGEFCRMEQGSIVETHFLLDLVDLMQQAGFHVLPPSRGADGLYPPPRLNDGILFPPQDERESQQSLALIRHFIFNGLNNYDQSGLESMGVAQFFHPNVQWYGPGGIGACLSLEEFEALHQQPWLHAYPDRQVQDLDSLFAEGCYSGASGWAGVKATHTGRYLDCPATGNQIDFNGLDFWRREGELFVENWVFVDMIHLFRQCGIDLFERLAKQIERSRSNE